MKKFYFFLSMFAVLLIIVLGSYILLNFQFSQYKYVVPRQGVDFVSTTNDPGTHIAQLKEPRSVTVSPEFVQMGSENSYMASSLTLLTTLFAAKNKDFIVVARVVNEKNELVECYSNFGDLKQNKLISVEGCNQFLNDSTTTRILVELPENIPKPLVIVEKNYVQIKPSSFSNVSYSTYIFLTALYPDTPQIIQNVNEILGEVK